MDIYYTIKEMADGKNMSIAEVERLAGLSNGTIGKWKEENKPTVDSLLKVCAVLEVDLLSPLRG